MGNETEPQEVEKLCGGCERKLTAATGFAAFAHIPGAMFCGKCARNIRQQMKNKRKGK
jgi:hypothetical protein